MVFFNSILAGFKQINNQFQRSCSGLHRFGLTYPKFKTIPLSDCIQPNHCYYKGLNYTIIYAVCLSNKTDKEYIIKNISISLNKSILFPKASNPNSILFQRSLTLCFLSNKLAPKDSP